jgi:hypothetical protein
MTILRDFTERFRNGYGYRDASGFVALRRGLLWRHGVLSWSVCPDRRHLDRSAVHSFAAVHADLCERWAR